MMGMSFFEDRNNNNNTKKCVFPRVPITSHQSTLGLPSPEVIFRANWLILSEG